MPREKLENRPAAVYVLTKTGTGLNDEGVQAARDLVFSSDPDAEMKYTGILALTGKHLLRAGALLALIWKDPDCYVMLSSGTGELTLCAFGPGSDGIQAVAGTLDQAMKSKTDSFTALMAACGLGNQKENME